MHRRNDHLPLRRSKARHALARTALLWLGCLLAAFASPPHAAAKDYLYEREPRRLALIIGNENYTNLAPLPSARADAEQMRDRLEQLGFDVTSFHPDVRTSHDFQSDQILGDFRRKIHEGDLVVVYYSGHGFSYGQFNYLVPTEMPLTVPANKVGKFAVSVDAVESLLASHSPGLIMFFVDACRTIGGFVVNNGQGQNVIDKGPAAQRDNKVGTNSVIFYATKAGMPADGSSAAGQPSAFTKALVRHINTEGRPFNAVFSRVAAEVRVSTSDTQVPGTYNWSQTDPYLKPTDKDLQEQRELWATVLDKRDYSEIEIFLYLNSVSRQAAAVREWLQDNLLAATPFTRISPVAAERAWREFGGEVASIRRMALPMFAYKRSLEKGQVQALESASDAELGVIPQGAFVQPGDSLKFSLASIDAHGTVVATQKLLGRSDPSGSAPVVESIASGTELQINGVVVGADKNNYVSASTREEDSDFFILIPGSLAAPATLELGQSIKEIVAAPRPDSIPGLVDAATIEAALAELKAQGWKVNWVSLATSATDKLSIPEAEKKVEQGRRSLRLANARYLLKRAGVEGIRITSVSGTDDFSGDGVRIRFFGVR